MSYQAELEYLQKVLAKHRVQTTVLSDSNIPIRQLDFGLRSSFGEEPKIRQVFFDFLRNALPNRIYKLSDSLHCHYIFLLLPESDGSRSLLVGPYLLKELTEQQLLEDAEHFGLPPKQFSRLRSCYSNIPVISDENFLFSLLIVFGETLWGSSEAFEVIDLAEDYSRPFSPLRSVSDDASAEDVMLNMQLMEQRYAYENELIQIVSQGLTHRAERMLSGITMLNFDRRMGDPIRDLKNYCIICNTLLRKAAEQGGVHPVYLDSVSSDFAQKIESSHSIESAQVLMRDMITSYCRLVKKYATKHYSSVVQRTITYIDTDLSADLSLSALAAFQKVNPSYLSSLFKRETGETLTEHVNKKRIAYAVQLLQSTKLQISSIAQHCGISDVNYFSKLFKKYTGLTPREFRASGGERL